MEHSANVTLKEEYERQEEKLKKCSSIVLYGNSIIACILKVALNDLGINSRIGIFDGGKFVSKCDKAWPWNTTVVITCSSRLSTRVSMKRDAIAYFPNAEVIDFYAVYYAWITKIVGRNCNYEELSKTLLLCRQEKCIFNIDSINTLFCNLRCKECSNGIQYRKEKRKIPVDSQIGHLKKLTDKMPINQCNFQGGEVFTDVDFAKFVEKHSYNPRIAVFTVATNGTILPKDEVFQVLRKTGSMVRISDYGVLSKEKDAIIKKCKEFKIPCFVFPMAEQWRKFGEYRKRHRTEDELKKISSECCFGTHDMMFIEDKIYCCLRTLFANAVGDNNDALEANTLNLDSDFTLEELHDFVQGKQLWKMCDYCDFPMELIEPGEQL